MRGLSQRTGVSLASYQRFEQTGRIELLSLIKIAQALHLEDESPSLDMIDLVHAARSAKSLMEMEHIDVLDPAIAKAGGTAGGATPKLLAAISTDRSRIITGASVIPAEMEAWLIKLNTAATKTSSICQLEKTSVSNSGACFSIYWPVIETIMQKTFPSP